MAQGVEPGLLKQVVGCGRVVDEPEEAVKAITKAHAKADFITPVPGTDPS